MSLQGCANRVNSKGASLWISTRATPASPYAAAVRIAGVVSIGGISVKRSGVVDATELDPHPIPLVALDIAERYFFTARCPGTKEIDPLSVELNLSWATYGILIDLYTTDKSDFMTHILFRSGHKLLLKDSYIESIEMNIQENTLVKTPVTFMPTFLAVYLTDLQALPAT